MEVTYNTWHGCHKKSEGCLNCYVYRKDESINKDSSLVTLNKDYDLPIRKNRYGEYKYPSKTTFMTCFSSDFFIEEADKWRNDVLSFMKIRNDCEFYLITKRPERINECLDIKEYPNLTIACTMENQKRVDERFPIYMSLPLSYHSIVIEPFLERIDLSKYNLSNLDSISVGGESGDDARVCDFEWIKEIHDLCIKNNIEFNYHQTGAKLLKDGKLYNIERKYQHSQARKAFK